MGMKRKQEQVSSAVSKPVSKKGCIAYQKHYKQKNYAKRLVWAGSKKMTSGGLGKADLMKNKSGKIVSKKKHANGKVRYIKNGLDAWSRGVVAARKEMNIQGFVPIGGKNNASTGTALYARVAELYAGEVSARMNALLQQVGSKCRVPSLVSNAGASKTALDEV